MKKLLLGLLLTVISTSAMAEWSYFGNTHKNDQYYLDFSTLKSSGNIRKIWYKVIHETPTKYGDVAEKTLSDFDCKNDNFRIVHLVSYTDNDMNNISSSIGNTDKTWLPIVPESITEEIMKLLCRKK